MRAYWLTKKKWFWNLFYFEFWCSRKIKIKIQTCQAMGTSGKSFKGQQYTFADSTSSLLSLQSGSFTQSTNETTFLKVRRWSLIAKSNHIYFTSLGSSVIASGKSSLLPFWSRAQAKLGWIKPRCPIIVCCPKRALPSTFGCALLDRWSVFRNK